MGIADDLMEKAIDSGKQKLEGAVSEKAIDSDKKSGEGSVDVGAITKIATDKAINITNKLNEQAENAKKIGFPNPGSLIFYLIGMVLVIGGIFFHIYLGVSNLGWFGLSLEDGFSPFEAISAGWWIFISWGVLALSLMPALFYLVMGFKIKHNIIGFDPKNIILSVITAVGSGGADLPRIILELVSFNVVVTVTSICKNLAPFFLIFGLAFLGYSVIASGVLGDFLDIDSILAEYNIDIEGTTEGVNLTWFDEIKIGIAPAVEMLLGFLNGEGFSLPQ